MEKATLTKLAKAIAKVHGHPDPDAYATAIVEAFDDEAAPKPKGKAK